MLFLKRNLPYFIISISYLLLFYFTQFCFQQPQIYDATLGKISANYAFDGDTIIEVKTPFIVQNNDNTLQWDALHYFHIKNYLYDKSKNEITVITPAFFPLFPIVWRASMLGGFAISILNYFIFCTALAILLSIFIDDNKQKYLMFSLSIMLPQTVSFIIPYSESVFMLCIAIVALAMHKQNYLLFFWGMFLIGLCRPASSFIAIAFVGVELIFFYKNKNMLAFIKNCFINITPLILGYFVAIFIQFIGTNNWHSLADAQKNWPYNLGIPKRIYDWSVEGYGLSSFCIFFVIFIILFAIIGNFKKVIAIGNDVKYASKAHLSSITAKKYLQILSCFYLLLIAVFTFFYRNGSLNSFQRYTLGTGFFYILFYSFPTFLENNKRLFAKYFIGALIGLVLFLIVMDYGQNHGFFKYLGMYLFIVSIILNYFFCSNITLKYKVALLVTFLVPSLVWNTYLLNMYLSNAWIFT